MVIRKVNDEIINLDKAVDRSKFNLALSKAMDAVQELLLMGSSRAAQTLLRVAERACVAERKLEERVSTNLPD